MKRAFDDAANNSRLLNDFDIKIIPSCGASYKNFRTVFDRLSSDASRAQLGIYCLVFYGHLPALFGMADISDSIALEDAWETDTTAWNEIFTACEFDVFSVPLKWHRFLTAHSSSVGISNFSLKQFEAFKNIANLWVRVGAPTCQMEVLGANPYWIELLEWSNDAALWKMVLRHAYEEPRRPKKTYAINYSQWVLEIIAIAVVNLAKTATTPEEARRLGEVFVEERFCKNLSIVSFLKALTRARRQETEKDVNLQLMRSVGFDDIKFFSDMDRYKAKYFEENDLDMTAIIAFLAVVSDEAIDFYEALDEALRDVPELLVVKKYFAFKGLRAAWLVTLSTF